MPYRICWEPPAGVYRQYLDAVTIAERNESFEAICSDPRFDSLRYCITDYLGVTSYEVTEAATAEIAALHVGPLVSNPRIAIAAVAVRPDVIAAIHDFMRLGFTAVPYQIFPCVDAARAWVRRHMDYALPLARVAPLAGH